MRSPRPLATPGASDAQWLVRDVFGRRWRLGISRRARARDGATTPGGATSAVRALTAASLARVERFDRASEALFAICNELSIGLPLSRNDWLRGDPSSRRRTAERISEALERAASTGRLRVEPLPDAFPGAPQALREATTEPARRPAPREQEGTTHFELRVVDEAGAAIGGLAIELAVGGARTTIVTNGRGIARLEGADSSFGSARVVSPEAVEEIVEPRRKVFRPVKLPEGEHTSIRLVRDLAAPVSLEAEVQHTLAIVPNHRRVRLIGMHFDTNKSFLLPSAMHGIRELHAIFEDAAKTQFLVVGHTDAHGTRAYNEQLSLERARSIIAFMKDDVDAWNDLFRAPAPEKRWGDREVNAMLSALPEGGPPFTTPEKEGKDPQAIKRFQQFSNETRGTALAVDGKAGPATRRALIEAYMALSHTSFPAGATTVAHGCGSNHPPPAEGNVPPSDAEMRRVDIFAFDGPIGPTPPGDISGPGSPEYDQWVAQMQSTFDVRTDVLPFRYAMQIGLDQQWSEAAKLTVLSEDLVDHESFVLADGERVETSRVFEFSGIRSGVRYRASILEGDLEMELFGFTELHAVALDDDRRNHLKGPPADPAAPFETDEDPPDTGVLNVRLFDANGQPMTNAFYRLSVQGEALGLAEDGVASIRLPSPCPPTGILEWGEPNEDGELEFRMEIALDCDDAGDRTSSMLHNLGYPRNLPLDTRVRSFQAQHAVGEAGLDARGAVPPATRVAIAKLYRERVG
jgi:outer membrane protein OmpA-like peptidoglycan-associated protein